jgi:hypothetical protein
VTPRTRAAAAAGAVLVLALLAVQAVTSLSGVFGDGPRGPAGSSYATGPEGLSSYAGLLRAQGREVVQRRRALDIDDALDPAGTVVVLDAPALAPEEARALRRFVAAGGRAVVGGSDPGRWLPALLDHPPVWAGGGNPACHPVLRIPEARGVTDVVLAGSGQWATAGESLPFLACQGRISATVASPFGARGGRVVLLADSGPLQNRFLSARDDRALGLAVVGPRRRVVFAEQVHGFGAPAGVLGLPAAARAALLTGVLAALLAVTARAARPRSTVPPLTGPVPQRLELATAVAARVARSRQHAEAAVPVQRAARAALARLAGLPAAAELDDEALRAAAPRADVTSADLDAVLRPAARPDDVVAAGRVLARLQQAADPVLRRV